MTRQPTILPREKILSAMLDRLEGAPRFDIEASLQCNLDCIMCPREKISRAMGIMSPGLLKRLPDWLPEENVEIFFCGMGEPSLNNHLAAHIKALSNGKRRIGMTSNATRFTPRFIEHLFDSGIDFVQISFNSLHKDRYERIMKGARFERIMGNLKRLSAMRPPSVNVELALTEQEENRDEVEEVRAFAGELGFGFQHNVLHSRGGNLEHEYKKNCRDNARSCGIFSRRHFISCTGDILACCHDLSGETTLGNVNRMSFDELLEVKRRRILDNQWFRICRHCDDLTRLKDLEET